MPRYDYEEDDEAMGLHVKGGRRPRNYGLGQEEDLGKDNRPRKKGLGGSSTIVESVQSNEDIPDIDKSKAVEQEEPEEEVMLGPVIEEPPKNIRVITPKKSEKQKETEKHENDEYKNPINRLIILGDIVGETGGKEYRINDGPEEGKFDDKIRLNVLKNLVLSGYDMGVFGLEVDRDGEGNLSYEEDLDMLNQKVVLKIVRELSQQKEKYDDRSFSDELVQFMAGNLEKFKKANDLIYRQDGVSGRKVKEEERGENGEKKKKLAWYEGILDDLSKALDPYCDPKGREELMKKLEGIDWPGISFDKNDVQQYRNRQYLRLAADVARGKIKPPYEVPGTNVKWKSIDEACDYLRRVGIDITKIKVAKHEDGKAEDTSSDRSQEKKTDKNKLNIEIENHGGINLSLGDSMIKEYLEIPSNRSEANLDKWRANIIELREYWNNNDTSGEEQELSVRKLGQLCRISLNPNLINAEYDKNGENKKFWDSNQGLCEAFGIKML